MIRLKWLRLFRPRRVPLRRLAPRLLALAALVVLLSGCFADRMILGENHASIPPAAGLTRRVVNTEGRTVECWVARSPGAAAAEPKAFVLFFVGKGDRAERWTAAVAGAWGGRPVEVWGMNFPGAGGSKGPARLADVGPDALGTFDEMRRVAGGRPVFLQAASFGTTAALCVAARRPVAGLVLQNPPPLKQLILGHYGWWNLWLVAAPAASKVPDDLDALANGPRASAPAVFILCGDDEIVPATYQRRVADAYAGPKRLIDMPGAHHSDPLTREAAEKLDEARDWLWRQAGVGQENRSPGGTE